MEGLLGSYTLCGDVGESLGILSLPPEAQEAPMAASFQRSITT